MRISITFFLRLFILLVLLFGIEFACVFISGKKTEAIPVVNSSGNEFAKKKKQDSVQIEVGTFLGNASRNYYGDSIGNDLDIIWKTFLGKGTTIVTVSKGIEEWFGAGWTGQPLVVRENGKTFLIQGAFDHHLKKINAETGEVIWNYEYDDILKGTGTIWMNDSAKDPLNRIVILQGSRKGVQNSMESPDCSSFRAVSFFTGKELWRMNVKHTASYSRDCDASALIFSDTAYIGLENGKFVRFDPGKIIQKEDTISRPTIYSELPLYNSEDNAHHGGNLVTESSPARIGNHIYITAGSGHVYGYNLQTKEMDWDFYIGSDMDGTPVVTSDSCILVEVEKQYISGKGGIFKLNPRLPVADCVEWFFPTEDLHFSGWEGGVIGSVALNDSYNDGTYQRLAAFTGIDGNLNVVQYDKISSGEKVSGPDGKTKYPTPVLQFSHHIGPSISTPVFTKGKLVAAGYQGINLFSFDKAGNFELEKTVVNDFEASPVADQGKVYIASRDGYLYCFGDTNTKAISALVKNADAAEKNIAVVSPENENITSVVPKKENTSPVVPKKENTSPVVLKKENTSPVVLKKEIIHAPISDKSFVKRLSRVETETATVIPKTETLAVVEKPKPAEIKPKPVEVKPVAPPVVTKSPSSGKFHLIAGVFRSKENAENFEKLWKSRGMDAQIFTSPKGMYYVSIGNAASESDLSGLMGSVKATYKMDAWIFEKE